jgi:accessory colonization factor AcfC
MMTNYINDRTQSFHMLEVNYVYVEQKYSLTIKLLNPLNIKKIESISQDNYIFANYTTLIRPRQIVVEYSYRF